MKSGVLSDERRPRVVSFKTCDVSAIQLTLKDAPNVFADDELAMLMLQSGVDIVDKMIHGMVAYISTLGFEMLIGYLRPPGNRVNFSGRSLIYMDECDFPSASGTNMQIFTAYFKRPAPKTESISNIPVSHILESLRDQCEKVALSRSCDWECCMCSEDLVGIQQLTLIRTTPAKTIHKAFEWPLTSQDRPFMSRVMSQPLQGYGHRPAQQRVNPLRYKLVIIGVNQSGLLNFVHNMLMLSGFRIVEAEIDTIRGGTYAHNTYVIETFSASSERLLRSHFQCVVPIRYSGLTQTNPPPPLFKSYPSASIDTDRPCGLWYEDNEKAYFGSLLDGQRHGFGRYWEANGKTTLSSYSYEGEWLKDNRDGFGFELKDDTNCVSYSFGRFSNGQLVDGTILYPFEPPMRSVRVVPHHKPNICVYKVLIHRAEYWVRQLPKSERPIAYLSANKIRPEYASNLRSAWIAFAESPIPCTASMSACQVAALLEVCGLHKTAKIAFAKRIDGGLLEAMTEDQSVDILNLKSECERNMLSQFLRVMARAYNIDRHMRQPTSVVDALYNPSISGKFFPLDKMRVVDNLGEGAYGKVIYAEYRNTTEEIPRTNSENIMSRMGSSNSLASRMMEMSSKSPMSQPSLVSALTARRGLLNRTPTRGTNGSRFAHTYLALKEQIGAGAELEKSCELVREWATLNALPHENIVKLEGICADTNAPKFNKRYLATALIEASLPSLIYRDPYSQAPELTPLLTIQLAGDIASGLAHMHSLHILHGDIKSPNILVDLRASNRPIGRICDFGHSAIRVGPRPQRRMCTFGWAAPESLRDGETDLSSDVWSWAVVVWEMYVKEIPWKGCSHPQMLAAVGFCGLDPTGFMGQRFPNRVDAEKKISELCAKCFRVNAGKRPRMQRVLQTVDKLSRVSTRTAFDHLHSLLR